MNLIPDTDTYFCKTCESEVEWSVVDLHECLSWEKVN